MRENEIWIGELTNEASIVTENSTSNTNNEHEGLNYDVDFLSFKCNAVVLIYKKASALPYYICYKNAQKCIYRETIDHRIAQLY